MFFFSCLQSSIDRRRCQLVFYFPRVGDRNPQRLPGLEPFGEVIKARLGVAVVLVVTPKVAIAPEEILAGGKSL